MAGGRRVGRSGLLTGSGHSAEAVAALAARRGVTLRTSTVLRVLRAQPNPTFSPPRVVGIDDWALAKGHLYATVVVDLERHSVLDILPNVAAWLRERPCIEVVNGDTHSIRVHEIRAYGAIPVIPYASGRNTAKGLIRL